MATKAYNQLLDKYLVDHDDLRQSLLTRSLIFVIFLVVSIIMSTIIYAWQGALWAMVLSVLCYRLVGISQINKKIAGLAQAVKDHVGLPILSTHFPGCDYVSKEFHGFSELNGSLFFGKWLKKPEQVRGHDLTVYQGDSYTTRLSQLDLQGISWPNLLVTVKYKGVIFKGSLLTRPRLLDDNAYNVYFQKALRLKAKPTEDDFWDKYAISHDQPTNNTGLIYDFLPAMAMGLERLLPHHSKVFLSINRDRLNIFILNVDLLGFRLSQSVEEQRYVERVDKFAAYIRAKLDEIAHQLVETH